AVTVGALTVTAGAGPHHAGEPPAVVVSCGSPSPRPLPDLGPPSPRPLEAPRPGDAPAMGADHHPAPPRDRAYPRALKERILGPYGHLSNGDVARYLRDGLGDSCRTVVLAHLSQKCNHPELARMAAEESLRRRGRTEVRLELTGPEGTDWIDVRASGPNGDPPPGPP